MKSVNLPSEMDELLVMANKHNIGCVINNSMSAGIALKNGNIQKLVNPHQSRMCTTVHASSAIEGVNMMLVYVNPPECLIFVSPLPHSSA